MRSRGDFTSFYTYKYVVIQTNVSLINFSSSNQLMFWLQVNVTSEKLENKLVENINSAIWIIFTGNDWNIRY